jgi:hypothetical protein
MNFARLFGARVLRPTWVLEHERIQRATRFTLDQAEAERMRVALTLNALKLEIRRRRVEPSAE